MGPYLSIHRTSPGHFGHGLFRSLVIYNPGHLVPSHFCHQVISAMGSSDPGSFQHQVIFVRGHFGSQFIIILCHLPQVFSVQGHFSPWSFRPWVISAIGNFYPESFQHQVILVRCHFGSQVILIPGHLAQAVSVQGHFSPWSFRPWDISVPGYFSHGSFWSLGYICVDILVPGHTDPGSVWSPLGHFCPRSLWS